MPKRWNSREREWVYRYLIERDGEKCSVCNKEPRKDQVLEIDHIDGNKSNGQTGNLRLLCKSCNVALGNKARKTMEQPSEEKERYRKEGRPETRIVRQIIDFRSDNSPTSMQANLLYEQDFRTWLLGYISANHCIGQQDAVNAGAEVVGCSPQTAARYINKLTSIAGPLKKHKDKLKNIILIFKDEFKEKGIDG